MGFFDTIGGSVSSAFHSIMDKNRKAALINRVKIVIKAEEQNAERAYIALGKYYYQNLRDETNGDTEIYCEIADRANRRLSRATARLTELMAPDAVLDEEDPIACDEACDACPGCPEPVSEEPYEPMSELHPEDDVLDGDASEAFQASDSEGKSTEEEKKSVQSEAAPASEPVAKEAADDSDDEGIPWA